MFKVDECLTVNSLIFLCISIEKMPGTAQIIVLDISVPVFSLGTQNKLYTLPTKKNSSTRIKIFCVVVNQINEYLINAITFLLHFYRKAKQIYGQGSVAGPWVRIGT